MKKTKLAVIETEQQKQERAEARQREREWNAIQEERARYSITDDQLDTILGELIDTFDQYFVESAFNFRENLNAGGGYWSSKHAYLETFIDKLDPYARHLDKKLRTVLPRKYPNLPGDTDDDLTQLTMSLEECAYVIGVFMGAKLAGASVEKLNLMRKHLVL